MGKFSIIVPFVLAALFFFLGPYEIGTLVFIVGFCAMGCVFWYRDQTKKVKKTAIQ